MFGSIFLKFQAGAISLHIEVITGRKNICTQPGAMFKSGKMFTNTVKGGAIKAFVRRV